MKILFFLFSLSSLAGTINIKTHLSDDLINNLIDPLWSTIDYQYSVDKSKSTFSNSISYSIENGVLVLAPIKRPLFYVQFNNSQNVDLKWKLEDATANFLFKIRFKFKQFGVEITHDEYFKAELNTILKASSSIAVVGGQEFKIVHQGSQNFKFENIKITARDGIGSTLRYILDNIFSQREVDQMIKIAINNFMADWINNSEIIKSAQTQLNQSIRDNISRKRFLPNLASTISFDINQIELSQRELSIKVDPIFHNDFAVHECASELEDKGNIEIDHSIFETILDNLTLNEVIVNSQIKEPLLCLGYKEGQDGQDINVSFLGRDINALLWITPRKKMKVDYDQDKIKIELNLSARVLTKQYPHIYFNGDELGIRSTLDFKIALSPKGLVLNFEDFKINSITGRAYLKWSRFIPKTRLPLSILSKRIENELKRNLRDEIENLVIVDKDLEINSQYKATIKSYTHDKAFSVGFDIQPY